MTKLPLALLFVCLTFLSWGVYGILLHEGQTLMGSSAMRSFVGVGIAYFLVAVMVPAILMSNQKEKGYWSFSGILLSLFAGTVGALGALGVLLALTFKGSPVYVMPLVFGFAPVVNTVVTMWLSKTFKQINPVFIVGIVLVILGAVGVLINKPRVVKHAPTAEQVASADQGTSDTAKKDAEASTKKEGDTAKTQSNNFAVMLSIFMAAVCWGSYGPFLHIGQMKMGGSRLRPFFCVGVAYFAIAVAAPLALLSSVPDQGHWNFMGMIWSIAAGTAGAVGALGIIMAFNFGAKPIYVMPLIFGFAPVVNTLVTIFLQQLFDQMNMFFVISLVIVVVGAVTVLLFAPKAKPHGPGPATPKPEEKNDNSDPPLSITPSTGAAS